MVACTEVWSTCGWQAGRVRSTRLPTIAWHFNSGWTLNAYIKQVQHHDIVRSCDGLHTSCMAQEWCQASTAEEWHARPSTRKTSTACEQLHCAQMATQCLDHFLADHSPAGGSAGAWHQYPGHGWVAHREQAWHPLPGCGAVSWYANQTMDLAASSCLACSQATQLRC